MILIRLTFVLILLLTFMSCGIADAFKIPLGGNAYITKGTPGKGAKITDNGLKHWSSKNVVVSVYFKLTNKESALQLGLRLNVHSGTSTIKVSIKGAEKVRQEFKATGEYYVQVIGTFKLKAGYVKLSLRGISKAGSNFASVSDVVVTGNTSTIDYVSDPANFLYGRRGPSVHFAFFPYSSNPFNYFYSELTVPSGQDQISSYFMANGFKHGYFGMQRNSETERRILFSVFGNFEENDASKIKPEDKVIEEKKGENVTVQSFGDEGSGMQSFLLFPWKTDVTYKYLLRGKPSKKVANSTIFTAWFKAPDTDWLLISSLRKPHLTTYLDGFYNFLENFDTEQGYLSRYAYYGNQWVRSNKVWQEVLEGYYYADATGTMNGRDDYSGGLTSDMKMFTLKNCGFFNEIVKSNQYFTRLPSNDQPNINLHQLP